MGDKFDTEAALKEHPEHEVAQYLAEQHGIDRNAFLKEGHTDADFIKEFGAMPLPSNTEQTNNVVTSPPLKPSATANAITGAVAAGVPLTVHGLKAGVQSVLVGDALKNIVKNQQPAKVVPPSVPGGGLQSYLNGHLLDQGFHGTLPVDNLSKAVYGEFGKIQTPSDVQDALKIIKGSPAQRVPVTRPGGTIYRDIPAVERIDLTPHLTPIPPPPKPSGREKLANVLSNPTAKKFATGYNAADYLQSEHTPEKIIAGVGAVAPWIEKVVPQKYKQSAKILGGGISTLAPAFNSVLHNLYNPEKPVEEHASGGTVGLDMLNEYTAPAMGGLKKAYNSPIVQKTMGAGNKGLQGLGMLSAFSVPENIQRGEYVDAGVNTVNSAASAAAMMPKLAAKIGAAGLGRAFAPLALYDALKPGTLNTGEAEEMKRIHALQDQMRREELQKSVVFKRPEVEVGPIQHYVDGGSIKNARKAAHELGGAPGRLTDWLQHHIGKFVVPTQSDRMGGVGGPSHSANSIALPEYKGFVWGSGNEGTTTAITNLAKDPRFGGAENQIFMPLLGSKNQHQSNQIVYDKMLEEFAKNYKNLTPEAKAQINAYMQMGGGISPKTGATKFNKFSDFDITDMDMLKYLGQSFEDRGLIAKHGFGGVNTGGTKSQVIPYQKMLDSMADPLTKGAPTFALGPRAFSLTGDVHPVPRPDLNRAFPYLLEGQDFGHTFNPVANKLIMPNFQNQWRLDKGKTDLLKSGELPQPGYYENTLGYKVKKGDTERVYPRQEVTEQLLDTLHKEGHAEGGLVENFQVGGLAKAKHSISQIPEVAKALEAYLKGNISSAERMAVVNKHLPIRQWNELPPNYTDEQIRNALMSNKQPLALADVPAGMQVGNRLDIPAYTQKDTYVDTVHNAQGKPISYNRTGHLNDVNFESRPNQAVRVGLGTKEQALTPMGAEIGSGKSPFALMRGTNVGTHDDEVRRMLEEYLKDPRWTQIGMDPRKHSQFFDKSTGAPVWSAEQKLQSGPLVMVPKHGLESTHWGDPRLELKDFPAKHYVDGGTVSKIKTLIGGLSNLGKKAAPQSEYEANRARFLMNKHPDVPNVMYHGTSADISEFTPKQAGATFLSPTPRFAQDFSDSSENYLATDWLKKLNAENPDKFGSLKKTAIRIANKNGSHWGDELETLARNQLPTRANILPVHVNATNPFDYENQKHLDALRANLLKSADTRDAQKQINSLGGGNWSEIESPNVQQAIKDMGHDSFWVREGGQKNLGIYNPNQIKSSIGNQGTFDPLNPNITKAEGGPVEMKKPKIPLAMIKNIKK